MTSDIATVLLFDGAYADGKALIVYQYYRRGINERWAIGGRLYDVRVTSLGPMLNISPPQGGHLVPQVVAVEGGFFVAWQEDESHRLLGRRVGVDGHLGEVVSLPVEGELRLVAHGGQAVALTERTIKDGSCQLERTILTPEARPSEPISTYPHCLTGRPSERPGPDGSPWLTFETEGERKHVWLARLTADGRKVEPPRPITDPGVWDEPRSMLVGDAMLVALVENRPVAGQPMASRIVVRQFDRLGRPIGKAQPIPGAASSTDMHDFALGRLGDRAAVIWGYEGFAQLLEKDGRSVGSAVKLLPQGGGGAHFIATESGALLLWMDRRHARDELFIAPVGCGGTVPTFPLAGPVVAKCADASPPPISDTSCAGVAFDFAVPPPSTKQANAGTPVITAQNGDLWTAWPDWRNIHHPNEVPELFVRKMHGQLPVGSESKLLSASTGFDLATFSDGRVLLVNAAGRDVRARFLGEASAGGEIQISDGLAEVYDVATVAGADGALVVWVAEQRLLLAREIDSKGTAGATWTLSSLPEIAADPVAAASPNGFVVAWIEGDKVRLARIADHQVSWISTGVEIEHEGDGTTLEAIGMIDDQIYVVSSGSILRFAADGSRLPNIKMPPLWPIAASVGANGLTLVTREHADDHDKVCVHRLDASAKPLDRPACVPLSGVLELRESTPFHLRWTGKSLYATSSGHGESRILHWRCAAAASVEAIRTEANARADTLAEMKRRENQTQTRWPAVLPCATFSHITAETSGGDELKWLTESGERRIVSDRPSGQPATRREIDAKIATDRPSWLAWRHLTPPQGSLTLLCGGNATGSLAWNCDSTAPQRCNVKAHYPRSGGAPSGVRGRDCPDKFKAREGQAPVVRSRALLRDALALIDRVCAGGRCSTRVREIAGRLRAARAEKYWRVDPVFPPREMKLTTPRGLHLELSCYGDVASNNRCMIELGSDIAYQQEESATDCAGGGENLLLPSGTNFLREDASGLTVAGDTLR